MRFAHLIACILFTLAIQAQEGPVSRKHAPDHDIYARVQIDLAGKEVSDLAKAGVDITHGTYIRNTSFTAVFPENEIKNLESLGFTCEVLIPDMQAYYLERNRSRGSECEVDPCFQEDYPYTKPQNFELGSMGGFFTYDQMLDHLDAMSFTYPHLITVKQPIGDYKTHEGRDILWIKISDNPGADEEEPEILYTALHHAREPMSLSQMIYFMWYLLEQYDANPEVRNIIDETELYFVPCLNPDGYILNNEMFPDGGGMWRKNGRDNNQDGILDIDHDGVDINRNYGHNWAHDNEGSSSNEGADTYRGPQAFSEPETRAMKFFCEQHDFKLALNYHSYGNVLLYPFGYDTSAKPADQEVFEKFGSLLVRENDYLHGTSFTALDYLTNGDANDWMYGEEDTKNAILTFTPEVGSACDDFYPDIDNIIPLCEQTLGMNLQLTKLVHGYGFVEEVQSQVVVDQSGQLDFIVSNYSTDPTQFSVSIEPLSDGILTVNLQEQVIDLDRFESQVLNFDYSLVPDIRPGDEVSFIIISTNGKTTEFDTIRQVYAPQDQLILKNGDDLVGWTQSGNSPWGLSNDAYFGGSGYTDSPEGNYGKNLDKPLMLTEEIDLTKATDAFVEFWAKWEIEDFFDYLVFQVSVDGSPWQNLCGEYTSPGSIFQEENEPVYDAIQDSWVRESISLEPYLGKHIRLRFVLHTDGFNELDGFYFDEFMVTAIDETSVSTDPELAEGTLLEPAQPNPAEDAFSVFLTLPGQYRDARIVLMDILGRPVLSEQVFPAEGRQEIRFHVDGVATGTYFYTLLVEGRYYETHRVFIK